MAYIGSKPADKVLTASDITDGIVSNAKLAQDIISADTALGAEPADTDEFLVSDAGVLKRMDYSYIKGAAGLNKIATLTEGSGHDYINIDDCFTSTYNNYLIVGKANVTFGNTNIGIRVRASGTPLTSSSYSRNIGAVFASTYADATSQTYIGMSYNDLVTNDVNWFFYVYSPKIADQTYVSGMMTTANLHSTNFAGMVNNTTAYDGIQIFNGNTGSGDLNSSKTTVYGLAL